jgi:hypothetical protein
LEAPTHSLACELPRSHHGGSSPRKPIAPVRLAQEKPCGNAHAEGIMKAQFP